MNHLYEPPVTPSWGAPRNRQPAGGSSSTTSPTSADRPSRLDLRSVRPYPQREKTRLIDSILHDYPIPLILLADISRNGEPQYEIIDGMQRLDAVFSFIENVFPLDDGRYFDIQELTRARQSAEAGHFTPAPPNLPRLSQDECARIIDYQLAVTIFPGVDESSINDIFGRIDSQGKQLSHQEQRQAGNVTAFAQLVRDIAANVRTDSSRDVLPLNDMPEISIETRAVPHGYGIKAEDTFWCKQGILRTSGLRDSEDEQMIADLLISILLDEPFAMSKEVTTVFSVLEQVMEDGSASGTFRTIIREKQDGNPVKAPFYAVFMAFFDLIVHQKKKPLDPRRIMESLRHVEAQLTSARSITTASRKKNIKIITGLIQDEFASAEPSLLGHGPGLALELTNSLRRSANESPRYEFKQGLLDLSPRRQRQSDLVNKLAEIACSMANIGPDAEGYIFLGVADNERDAERIHDLDKVRVRPVGHTFVVGLEREAKILGVSFDTYMQQFVQQFSQTELSEPLKSELLSHIDYIDYYGLQVARLVIPSQQQMSWVGDDTFIRQGANTLPAKGKAIAAIQARFSG